MEICDALKWRAGHVALLLLTGKEERKHEEGVMTKEKWLLLGALILSILVVLYVVFLCPSDCH